MYSKFNWTLTIYLLSDHFKIYFHTCFTALDWFLFYILIITRSSAIAEGQREALVSRNPATTKHLT